LASKDVPVNVRYSGELPPGYRVADTRVQPPRLRVVGAEGRMQNVSTVETDAIDLAHMTQTGDFRVNAFVSDPELRFDSSPVVTVKVTIERTGNSIN
jgi:YbbR domain-containing protein